MISAIIFDLEGTVCPDNSREIIRGLSLPTDPEPLYSKMLASKPLYECMKGKISFKDFKREFADIAKLDIETIDSLLQGLMGKRHVDKEIINLSDMLKEKKVSSVVHSDSMKVPFDFWVKRFSLRSHFDHLLCSAYMGTLKSQIETFYNIQRYLSEEPSRIVYIDSRESNIYTAEKAGFDTIRFTGAGDLIKKLEKKGIIFG